MAGTVEAKTKRHKSKKSSNGKKSTGHAVPLRLRNAILSISDDLEAQFPAWVQYLDARKQPKSLVALLKSEKTPLLWAIGSDILEWGAADEAGAVGSGSVGSGSVGGVGVTDDTRNLVKRLQKASAGKISGIRHVAAEWASTASHRKPTAAFGLECLAWVSALPKLASEIPSDLWATLFGTLLDIAKSDYGSLAEKNPWDSQLILGELPIALGYFFPEFDECCATQRRGCEFVSSSIKELLDGDGVCEAQHLALLRKLAACWVRCAWMTNDATKKSLRLSKAARKEVDWLVRQVLRLTRFDHSFAFQPLEQKPDADLADMISCALRWTKDSEDKALAKLVIHGEQVSDNRLPEDPGFHSEWSEVAILQSDWDPQGPRLALTFDNLRVRAELSNRGEVIFSGPWEPTFVVDGNVLDVISEWEVNCWFSDFDVDFLELEAELTGGWRVQRQFMMARQDHFLWSADVLLGEREAELEYRLDTKLAPGITMKGKSDSRECHIKGKRALATVCPPGLPEWRQQTHLGEFTSDSNVLKSTYHHKGTGLYVPMFFDMHRRRMRQPITWRQLTVAENLGIVGPETAVGYRVQVGPEQWLCYRSMTSEEGNRTLLGQNYSEEFVLARFLSDGDAEALVEIGGEDDD